MDSGAEEKGCKPTLSEGYTIKRLDKLSRQIEVEISPHTKSASIDFRDAFGASIFGRDGEPIKLDSGSIVV